MINICSEYLDFKHALGNAILNKHLIKLPEWGGYWFFGNGGIHIMTRNGEVLNFRDVEDILTTLSYTFREDWISFTDSDHERRLREARNTDEWETE